MKGNLRRKVEERVSYELRIDEFARLWTTFVRAAPHTYEGESAARQVANALPIESLRDWERERARREKKSVKPKPTSASEKLVGMYAHRPFYLTAEEYETLQKELMARAIVGDTGLGDRILLRLLQDNQLRYHEISRTREEKKS